MDFILLLAPILLPLIGSLCIASPKIMPEKWVKPSVAIMVFVNLGLVTAANLYAGGEFLHLFRVNQFIDIFLKLDQFGRLFSYMASVLWVIASFYSFEYMKHEGRERRFFTFYMMTLSMIIGLSYSGNLLTLYFFYELITLTTFPLVIHLNTEVALQIGRKYITYSFVGAAFVMIGMVLLYSATGSTKFYGGGIEGLLNYQNQQLILFSYLSMFIGFGVKAALVPLHAWLPASMIAPTPVSALLHAVAVVKSGIFALTRITYYIYGSEVVKAVHADKILIPFAILSIILGSLIAMSQYHLKRRLAYSTIAQLGYITLGILMLNPYALLGALLHMINHAVIKINLFFGVGAITYMTEKKYVRQIGGLGKKMPMTFICFSIAAISLIGIPPTNGFVSKWFLGLGALKSGNIGYAMILLFGALLTASYLLPIIVMAFFTNSKDKVTVDDVQLDPPKMMMIPIFILTGMTVLLGLYPNPVIEFIQVIVTEVF
jgi:multicomponent Na+:H+ antiporter subunit D